MNNHIAKENIDNRKNYSFLLVIAFFFWNVLNIFLFTTEYSFTLFTPFLLFLLLNLIYKINRIQFFIKEFIISFLLTFIVLSYISFYLMFGGDSEICKGLRYGFVLILLLNYKHKYNNFYLSNLIKYCNRNIIFSFIVPLFFFYSSFSHSTASSDLIPARFLPFWIEDSKLFSFEKLVHPKVIINKDGLKDLESQINSLPYKKEDGTYQVVPYYLVYIHGEYLPTYPLIPGFINYSFFKLLNINNLTFPFPVINAESPFTSNHLKYVYNLEKLTSALVAVFSSYLLIILLKSFPFSLSSKTSLYLGIIYSIGSLHFSTSSQALWQHGFIELFIIIYLYIVSKIISNTFKNIQNKYLYILLGIISTCIPFSRPSGIILLLGIGIYLPILKKIPFKKLLSISKYALLGFLIMFAIHAGINLYFYGNIIGGYQIMKESLKLINMVDLWNYSYINGLAGLYFSPGYGLFIFSPFLMFIFISTFRKRKLYYSVYIIFLILIYSLFYSKYIFWTGGHTYGTRLLTDLMPFFILLIGICYKIILKYKIYKYIFIFTLLFSITVQWIGASDRNVFSEWNGCDDRGLEDKIWDYKNMAFMYPFQKYKILLFGEYSMIPSLKCSLFKKSKYKSYYISDLTNNTQDNELLYNWNVYIPSSDLCISMDTGVEGSSSLKLSLIINKKNILENTILLQSEKNIPNFKKIEFNIDKEKIKSGNGYLSLIQSGEGIIYLKNIKIRSSKCK